MMFPSHLLATLLLGAALHRVRPMRPRDWQLAITFGVLMDLDHAARFPAFVAAEGWRAVLDPWHMLQWGNEWRGVMHEPMIGGAVAVGAAVVFRSAAPVAFWGLHMVQDFVVARHYVAFGSVEEWAIIGLLLTAALAVFLSEDRAGESLRTHWMRRLGFARMPPVPAEPAVTA